LRQLEGSQSHQASWLSLTEERRLHAHICCLLDKGPGKSTQEFHQRTCLTLCSMLHLRAILEDSRATWTWD
jgi:hypothetical protein